MFRFKISGIYLIISDSWYNSASTHADIGASVQYTFFETMTRRNNAFRLYWLGGVAYWFSEHEGTNYYEEETTYSNKERSMSAGAGFGIEFMYFTRLAFSIEIGYAYNTSFDIDTKTAMLTGGIGIGFAF